MKQELFFKKPILNAAGMLGFAPEARAPIDWEPFGAFITNPLSLRPRMPAGKPAVLEYPGGFLLHSGLPNPGLSAVLEKFAARWERAALPVIVHLMADRPEETGKMVRMLEGRENVMAVELGFAPLLADDLLFLALEMCRGELPLIVSLEAGQLLRNGARLMAEGASAISLAPPRGTLMVQPGRGLVEGRLYGPSLFPQSLDLVRAAARAELPIIGSGGLWSMAQAEAMLEAGALAVQMDAGLWLPKNKDLVE
jgi:dihydroorotate dehydrogenase (NAD+) catalytic subunit